MSSLKFAPESMRVFNLSRIGVKLATLASSVVTSSLTSVGTIATGTWQGTAVGVLYGGTGSTTASGARTALGLAIGTDVQAYSSQLAALAANTATIDGGTF